MRGADIVFRALLFVQAVWARGPPTVINKVTQRQIARVGETVRLSCPVEADPPALLQWSKDGDSINRGWERFKILSLSLRIKGVVVEDTGMYKCKATNGFGHVTVDYHLIVLHANQSVPPPEEQGPSDAPQSPRFSKPELMQQSPVLLPVGSNTQLYCPASGHPEPDITWYKDGKYFDAAAARQGVNVESWNKDYNYYDDLSEDVDEKWTLVLRGLQETDSGDYRCVVRNLYGEESFTYTLQIMAATAKPILIPPNPRNMTVKYGQMASFMCEVRSLDQPHIQWLKRIDGTVFPTNNSTIKVNGQHFAVLRAGEVLSRSDGSFLNKLTIEDATEKDSGMYICLGANNRGYNFRSAFLTVSTDPYYHSKDFDAVPQDTSSFWDNRALPVIIGVPAGVILIIVAIIICVIKRKQSRIPHIPHTVAGPNHVVRVQRFPPQPVPYGPPQPEKAFDHQYAALHPHNHNYSLQDTTSQERIMKTYSDKHSDVSFQGAPHSSGTPPLPSLAPTPTLVQQHTHMHYYQRT